VRLQTKLELAFFLLVIFIVSIFVFIAIRAHEAEEKTAFELRAISLASLLGESVSSVFYEAGRLDRIRSLLKNVLQQPYVVYVYAYDQDGRILADGTVENRYSNSIWSSRRSTRECKLIVFMSLSLMLCSRVSRRWARNPLGKLNRSDPTVRMLRIR
jgi:uncharacterized membrane protein affecting hemolysin expression